VVRIADRANAAEQVREVLRRNQGNWLPASMVGQLVGRTRAEVYDLIGDIRDAIPEMPLISSNRGYVFTVDMSIIRPFALWRCRTVRTILARYHGGVIIPLTRLFPNLAEARRVNRDVERLLQDMDDLVASL
jgi:hypothetical protein